MALSGVAWVAFAAAGGRWRRLALESAWVPVAAVAGIALALSRLGLLAVGASVVVVGLREAAIDWRSVARSRAARHRACPRLRRAGVDGLSRRGSFLHLGDLGRIRAAPVPGRAKARDPRARPTGTRPRSPTVRLSCSTAGAHSSARPGNGLSASS